MDYYGVENSLNWRHLVAFSFEKKLQLVLTKLSVVCNQNWRQPQLMLFGCVYSSVDAIFDCHFYEVKTVIAQQYCFLIEAQLIPARLISNKQMQSSRIQCNSNHLYLSICCGTLLSFLITYMSLFNHTSI